MLENVVNLSGGETIKCFEVVEFGALSSFDERTGQSVDVAVLMCKKLITVYLPYRFS